jgi:glycosyltransferase involved in cell wall biosynthesis
MCFGHLQKPVKRCHNLLPISVLITTLNEAKNIARCLNCLHDFDDIIVIDSNSVDDTKKIVKEFNVRIENFMWDGQYPKKRQWCLENIDIKNDFVFFIDADEEITSDMIEELKKLNYQAAGYFIKGQYVWNNKVLKYGLKNNKLALINRHKIYFPEINDLNINGMGEIEGHYQPVFKADFSDEKLEQIKSPLLHYAYDDNQAWQARHLRYAIWEADMIISNAYPRDPIWWRQKLKSIFRTMPYRGLIAFTYCYIFKFGFLDGRSGFEFAKSRFNYYSMVSRALKTNKALARSVLNKR